MFKNFWRLGLAFCLLSLALGAQAQEMESASYQISQGTFGSTGGIEASSLSYGLSGLGGEAFAGSQSSASYQSSAGSAPLLGADEEAEESEDGSGTGSSGGGRAAGLTPLTPFTFDFSNLFPYFPAPFTSLFPSASPSPQSPFPGLSDFVSPSRPATTNPPASTSTPLSPISPRTTGSLLWWSLSAIIVLALIGRYYSGQRQL